MSSTILTLINTAVVVSASVVLVFVVAKLMWGLGLAIGGIFGGVGRLAFHIAVTLRDWVTDTTRIVGGLLTGVTYIPLALLQVALGRWSSAKHYGKAMGGEFGLAALSTYKAGISHPLRLIGLGSLLEGFERRLPEVMLYAPGADTPKEGALAFEGWRVVGSLPAGGSGAKLYLAEPNEEKVLKLARVGVTAPAKAVIKAFSLDSGSTLPQIVRESRALEAAKTLGLVVEHELSPSRFHYVMPFVPGEDLSKVATALHASSKRDGLRDAGIRAVIGYGAGLCEILDRFHAAGLWHKDIKPSNILVSGDRVELVDLGLVTQLGSAMTLTTHGTEYYRDPEMVRLALKGVKVHEVDGVKFDLYSTGAVLYSLIEGSFPAHGNLSSFSKRCPDALSWVIRRAMADVNRRYASAGEMLTDLQALAAARDPFELKPSGLPSMGGARAEQSAQTFVPEEFQGGAHGQAQVPPQLPDLDPSGWAGMPPPLPEKPLSMGELRRQARAASVTVAREARLRARRASFQAKREVRSAATRLAREAQGVRQKAAVDSARRRQAKSEQRKAKRSRQKHSSVQSAVGLLLMLMVGLMFFGVSSRSSPQVNQQNVFQPARSSSLAVGHEAPSNVLAGSAQHQPQHPQFPGASARAPQVLLLPERPLIVGAEGERRLVESIQRNFGWRVLSENEHGELSDSQLELLAEARSRAGLNSFNDRDASRRLQEIIEKSEGLDGIVWYGFDQDQSLKARLLTPRVQSRARGGDAGGLFRQATIPGKLKVGVGGELHEAKLRLQSLVRELETLQIPKGTSFELRRSGSTGGQSQKSWPEVDSESDGWQLRPSIPAYGGRRSIKARETERTTLRFVKAG